MRDVRQVKSPVVKKVVASPESSSPKYSSSKKEEDTTGDDECGHSTSKIARKTGRKKRGRPPKVGTTPSRDMRTKVWDLMLVHSSQLTVIILYSVVI